jgi:cytosine deaminase
MMKHPADFIVLNAKNYYDALNQDAVVKASYKAGRKIAETVPSSESVLF